jgi:hypothetical protein
MSTASQKFERQECRHGRPLWCDRGHDNDDVALGQPLCGECYA